MSSNISGTIVATVLFAAQLHPVAAAEVDAEPAESGGDYEIAIRDLEPQPVASVRAEVPHDQISEKIAELTWEVYEYLQAHEVKPAGRPFTRYHSYTAKGADLEVGFPIDQDIPGSGRVEIGRLPGGRVAVTTHAGSYAGLGRAQAALAEFVEESTGGNPDQPAWQVYLVAPGDDPDPASWRTRIFLPLNEAPAE